MKSLKSICEDNITHSMYEVLANIDDQNNTHDNSIPDSINKWINENYECKGLKISDKPNSNGLYKVHAHKARVKNKNTTSLTNGMFEWKKINDFSCVDCTSLKSLEGAPKEVKGDFTCCECENLSSLEGAPEKVGGDFNCAFCSSLKSLVGAPKEIGKDFSCAYCTSLTSLEGAPKKVGRDFSCFDCKNLSSLMGSPKEVGGDFHCYYCKIEFTENDVEKVSDVKGEIFIK